MQLDPQYLNINSRATFKWGCTIKIDVYADNYCIKDTDGKLKTNMLKNSNNAMIP